MRAILFALVLLSGSVCFGQDRVCVDGSGSPHVDGTFVSVGRTGQYYARTNDLILFAKPEAGGVRWFISLTLPSITYYRSPVVPSSAGPAGLLYTAVDGALPVPTVSAGRCPGSRDSSAN